MIRIIFPLILAVLIVPSVFAQGVLGDVLSGKLVDPAVGQWAWYDLVDGVTGKRYLMRQAVVGEEKIGRKTAHWFEVEVVPDVGYSSVYKMLLTGPASDPKNLHRLLIRQGNDPVAEVPVDRAAQPEDESKAKRDKQGKVDIETPKGIIRAEHVVVENGDTPIELWLSDDVVPMGVVQMRGDQGELTLRDYGLGGENALSRLNMYASGPEGSRRTTTRVEGGLLDPPDDMRTRPDGRAGSTPPSPGQKGN